MNRTIILIGIGGFIGSIARYLTVVYFTKNFPSSFPYGTMAVNIIGCLLIGIVFGLSNRFDWFTPELRLFLATGICGGFTTFSAFAYENVVLLQQGHYLQFAIYSFCSFAIGIIAVFSGLIISKI
jgi:CrcB protein